jgi:hypothetical protein
MTWLWLAWAFFRNAYQIISCFHGCVIIQFVKGLVHFAAWAWGISLSTMFWNPSSCRTCTIFGLRNWLLHPLHLSRMYRVLLSRPLRAVLSTGWLYIGVINELWIISVCLRSLICHYQGRTKTDFERCLVEYMKPRQTRLWYFGKQVDGITYYKTASRRVLFTW